MATDASDENRALLRRVTRPRCWLIYALAPEGMAASEANRVFNVFIGDRGLPLVVFHDHFIGQPGGLAIFYAAAAEEREALGGALDKALRGWRVEARPLIFAYSPAAFDEQTAFTLRAYREMDWEAVQKEARPAYGDPRREAETAGEDER
jgi:hypothetical protein